MGEFLNTECECTAGKGPNGTCKHVAAVMLLLVQFLVSDSGELMIQKTCTESLQIFHQSRKHIVVSVFV